MKNNGRRVSKVSRGETLFDLTLVFLASGLSSTLVVNFVLTRVALDSSDLLKLQSFECSFHEDPYTFHLPSEGNRNTNPRLQDSNI